MMTFVIFHHNTLVRLFELIRFDFYVSCQLAGKAELQLSKMNMFYSLSFLIKPGYRALELTLEPDFWNGFWDVFLFFFLLFSNFKAIFWMFLLLCQFSKQNSEVASNVHNFQNGLFYIWLCCLFASLICSQEKENIHEPDNNCVLIGAHNFAKTNHKLTGTYIQQLQRHNIDQTQFMNAKLYKVYILF